MKCRIIKLHFYQLLLPIPVPACNTWVSVLKGFLRYTNSSLSRMDVVWHFLGFCYVSTARNKNIATAMESTCKKINITLYILILDIYVFSLFSLIVCIEILMQHGLTTRIWRVSNEKRFHNFFSCKCKQDWVTQWGVSRRAQTRR